MEPFVLVALAILLAGVVGSVVPLVPGAGLSLLGIYLYWWSTGYAEPGPWALLAFTVVGVAAIVTDQFGGALAASAGGASTKTVVVATLVSVPLLFVAGPVGLVLGVAGAVFVAELYRTRSAEQGTRAAVFAAVGVLGSALVQLVVTLSLLVAFLFVAF
ncbi:DUF456 domain-containing protein [Halorussus sp. MSC15.2]|uniref:DUF456 domain-containing protein n=1 Tax=Halorussus sp. MSC15.2 TaxID=2283638 RepID=UPI0013D1BA12|nr:DUF456 domain-containing protein [Halorussus sp. MSC15.2]NEU58005.1 DUF456 domain-containing protein [Halorussus sp. MSC15.2]